MLHTLIGAIMFSTHLNLFHYTGVESRENYTQYPLGRSSFKLTMRSDDGAVRVLLPREKRNSQKEQHHLYFILSLSNCQIWEKL